MGLLARDLRQLTVLREGRVGYAQAQALQDRLHAERVRDDIGDTFVLLEHPHVYTVGRRGSRDDILLAPQALGERDVEVIECDRGGRVTYHGPGQLVGYPIIDLGPGADLMRYVRRLEDVMIGSLARFGVAATRDGSNTGVWVGPAKIGAIGVRVARNVTKHGFALNVAPDLSYFAGIVPCGITDKGVTSMSQQGVLASPDEVAEVVLEEFRSVFGYAP